MLIGGFIFQLLPRPAAWTLQHVHKEDGRIFLTDFLNRGWGSLFELYSGYMHVVPRGLAGIGLSLFPLSWYAVWVGVCVALVKVALCALAYPVFTVWLENWRWGLAAASTFLLLPIGQQEVLGNLTNLRWYMSALAVIAAFARFTSWWANALLALTLICAVLTEPLTVLALPALVLAATTGRGWARLPGALGALAIAVNLLFVMRPDDRGDVVGPIYYLTHPVDSLTQAGVRGFAASEFGQNLSMLAMKYVGAQYWLVGVAIAAALVFIGRGKPMTICFSWALILHGLAILLVTLGFTSLDVVDLNQWFAVGQTSRYSTGAALLIVPGIIGLVSAGVARSSLSRWLSYALITGMAMSLAADARGDNSKDDGPTWVASLADARAQCENSSNARLQFTPVGTKVDWASQLSCDKLK